jgi:hypothetical protein
MAMAGAVSQWNGFGLVQGGLGLVAKAEAAEPNKPYIDPEAFRLVHQMGRYLSAAREFSFRADVTYDVVFMENQKLQYAGTANVSVRRPNKLHVRYLGEERQTGVFYDGKTFTIFDPVRKVYTKTKVPPKIDAAVDMVFDKYGFSVPIADFVHENPHLILMENVESGFVVGRTWIHGRPVHHLAFTQGEIDWQIWIENGPTPLPRKLLITYKNQPGSPQYTAVLSKWDFTTRLSDSFAEFHPPLGSDEIQFFRSAEWTLKPQDRQGGK